MDNLKLPDNLTNTWEKYNQMRVAGVKKAANNLLLEYIDLLKQQDETVIKNFVDYICGLNFDADEKILLNIETEASPKDITIQHPLFKEIILPVLIDQYKKDSAKHIRWIGQFEQYFYSDNSTTLAFLKAVNIEGHFETRHFFEKSFSIDKNQMTIQLLLNRIAQDINYYIHEVPIGVLVYPEVLNNELLAFKKYWQQCDTKNIWNNILTHWELIAKHWTIYHENLENYDNFEHYLNTNGIQIDL